MMVVTKSTYRINIDALPALAAGSQYEVPASTIRYGSKLDINHFVAASEQHKNRKRLAALIPPLATVNEVASSKRRKHLVESFHFHGTTPAWAQEMQTQIEEQNLEIQNLRQEMEDKANDAYRMVQRLEWKLMMEDQRKANCGRLVATDPIRKIIRLSDGMSPSLSMWFPWTLPALLSASENYLNPLLTFYNLPSDGNIEDKRMRLILQLGISV